MTNLTLPYLTNIPLLSLTQPCRGPPSSPSAALKLYFSKFKHVAQDGLFKKVTKSW